MEAWEIFFHEEFADEFANFDEDVQNELISQTEVIEKYGPNTGRPHVDTLNGSQHANMKELRFKLGNGVWRFAFAFDPKRRAIVLCGGDKCGKDQERFYKRLIKVADERFGKHLKES